MYYRVGIIIRSFISRNESAVKSMCLFSGELITSDLAAKDNSCLRYMCSPVAYRIKKEMSLEEYQFCWSLMG